MTDTMHELERHRQACRRWRERHPGENAARCRAYYAKHRDERLARKRFYQERVQAMGRKRFAVYGLEIDECEIRQTPKPLKTFGTLEEAKAFADHRSALTARAAAVWLEEKVAGRWQCVESDIYCV